MTKRRKRLEDDLRKLLAKQAEVEEKIRETREQITEEANTEIHEMVRAANLTPEQLAEVLAALKGGAVPGNGYAMTADEEDKEDAN